jgi:membrane-bound lytic murein transglycosylase D
MDCWELEKEMNQMKKTILIFFMLGGLMNIQAQTEQQDEIELLTEKIAPQSNLDSLVSLWHLRNSVTDLVVDTISAATDKLYEQLPDSVYIARLAAINSPIPFPFNTQVKSYIQLYTQRRREQVETMLGLSEYYFPIFEAALDARNMPLELKYLPIIESALNPTALSRAGASGIWQFMYYTGKQYGLEVNSYVDERRDPVKATLAAVDFLADLYTIYGDWHLVIAAYNCGPGNVNKAIRRSGGKRDFWEIFYRLPRETRGYVPAFIAAAYTMTYPREHEFMTKPSYLPIATDTIMIGKPLHFNQIADVLQVPVQMVRELNPQYRRDVVPAKGKAYPLRLAFDHSTLFASLEDSVFNYRRNQFFPDNKLVVAPSDARHAVVSPSGREAVSYTVKTGDAVGVIADAFDVSASDLRYWNDLRGNLIKVGQQLVVYVPKGKQALYQGIANARMGKTETLAVNRPITNNIQANLADGDYIYHVVRSGENLWTIAQQYPGVSNEDILRLNNISDARKLKPGQKLKIKPRS